MPWRQFYHNIYPLPKEVESVKANADLHHTQPGCYPNSPARLMAYRWQDIGEPPSARLELIPANLVGVQRPPDDSVLIEAIIAPSYPRSFMSRTLADHLVHRGTPKIDFPQSCRDVLENPITFMYEVEALPIFWQGDDCSVKTLSPSPIIAPVPRWGVVPEIIRGEDFLVLGRDMLCKIISILSDRWILIGGSEKGRDDIPPAPPNPTIRGGANQEFS